MIFRQIVDKVQPKAPPHRADNAAKVKDIFPRRQLNDESENWISNRDANGAADVSCNEFASL